MKNELGELVRSYRKFKGLVQEDLAYKVGKSITTISRIENDIPVGPHTLEIVLRELAIPVFCSAYSLEYSKVIAVKRELLMALYCDKPEWYFEAYEEYKGYRELAGIMGEMYSDYFRIMYQYLLEANNEKLYKALITTFNKIATIKIIAENLETQEIDIEEYRYLIRRNIKENGSEIDILLVNGIANALMLRGKYYRAEIVFEELINELIRRERTFKEKYSNVPIICYNFTLCLSLNGKHQKARNIIEEVKELYKFREDLRLEKKYEKLMEVSGSWEKDFNGIGPILSFPSPVFWYTLSSEVKNLKKY